MNLKKITAFVLTLPMRLCGFAVAAIFVASTFTGVYAAYDSRNVTEASAFVDATENDRYCGIEQIEISLEELAACGYEVTVDVFFNYAEDGIQAFTNYLYYVPVESPEDGTILDPGNTVANGGQLVIKGVVSKNFASVMSSASVKDTDMNCVVGLDFDSVYNDDQTKEPGRVTLYTMTFEIPENAVAGDQFNIVWWNETDIFIDKNVSYTDYDLVNGFIRITDYKATETTTTTTSIVDVVTTTTTTTAPVAITTSTTTTTTAASVVDVSCNASNIEYRYADDKSELDLGEYRIIAVLSDQTTIDITDDCTVADDLTPYSLYWNAHNADNETFDFTADILYKGSNEDILLYLDYMNTDTVCSAPFKIALRGDINLDDVVDARDCAYMAHYCSHVAIGNKDFIVNDSDDAFAKFLGDVDGDGAIDTKDAAYAAGYISVFAYTEFDGITEDEFNYNFWKEMGIIN